MLDRSFLDWPFFEAEHRAAAAAFERWAAEALPNVLGTDEEAERDVHGTVRRLVAALGRAGLLRHAAPGAEGPNGGHVLRTLCLARETFARSSSLADFAFAMQGLGSAPISLYGTDAQRRRYLPGVCAGKTIAAFALSEAEAGSDVAAMTTSAVKCAGGYRLDGGKTWISNAGLADFYVVFARTGEGARSKGISAFIVDSGTPGFTIGKNIDIIAPHPLGSLGFENCVVGENQLLGKPGEGFKIAMATLDIFRSTVGAAALGFARRAFDEAVQRSVKRQLFGNAMASLQMIQEKIADMALAIDAAALLIYRAAWTKDTRGGRISREASMAKLYATEEAQRVIDQAVQIFGGLGVVRGVAVERLYREIRALRIYEGASEVQKLVIAGEVLQAARSDPSHERQP
ncbi:MAG: acyl-CoA dehydrogenase family protein [Alphaproteobacteria bacterium]|nr:acyl-CoA dehydrogenase family protein [Alphaproteobacteria bacterium]